MSDYTPTSDEIRDIWTAWSDYGGLTSRPHSGTSDDRYAEFDRWLAARDAKVAAKALAPIRAALANHPRCDIHPDDDPVKCGWKRAIASVQAVLDKEDR